jgi:hypothetical protein
VASGDRVTEDHIRELPWATLDDLLEALDDFRLTANVYARIVDVDGDLRLKRIDPKRVRRS